MINDCQLLLVSKKKQKNFALCEISDSFTRPAHFYKANKDWCLSHRLSNLSMIKFVPIVDLSLRYMPFTIQTIVCIVRFTM